MSEQELAVSSECCKRLASAAESAGIGLFEMILACIGFTGMTIDQITDQRLEEGNIGDVKASQEVSDGVARLHLAYVKSVIAQREGDAK